MSVLIYNFLLTLEPKQEYSYGHCIFFFFKCGENVASVTKFVATLDKTLDAAGLKGW